MNKTVILVYAATVTVAVAGWGLFAAPIEAQQNAGLKSLRGDTPLTAEPKAPELKDPMKDHPPEARAFVHQPPLIPHTVRDYRITATHNKCMECHSWQTYREFKATKISMSHFKDRTGADTATVSPLRYFCDQCHVPQVDAKPLVENTFKPIEAIKPTVK